MVGQGAARSVAVEEVAAEVEVAVIDDEEAHVGVTHDRFERLPADLWVEEDSGRPCLPDGQACFHTPLRVFHQDPDGGAVGDTKVEEPASEPFESVSRGEVDAHKAVSPAHRL